MASHLTPASRPAAAGVSQQYQIGGRARLNTDGRRHIRLDGESVTANIGKFEVVDVAQPLSREFRVSALRRGVVLDPRRAEAEVRADFYGGQSNNMKITVNVS